MNSAEKKKLVLIGTGVVHTFKYLDLISSFFDEILLITDKPGKDPKCKQVKFDFSLRSPLSLRARIRSMRKLIDEFNPSVVHVHQANSCAFYAIKACRKKYPLVVTAWGSDILSSPARGFLYARMLKYILRNADFFTSDSLFMAEEMRRISGNRELEILIANFGIDIVPANAVKEDLIYSNRQLTPLYRIDRIIALFIRFVLSDPAYRHWQLALAATGPEEERLRKLVNEAGLTDQIRFYGWVDKAQNSSLYNRARFYISIPESDATSISLLEAMASSCIPIVSDLPANREWIRDGINGIILRNTDEDVFQRALQIDSNQAIAINTDIIQREGTKEANREKFILMYQKLMHGN